MTLQSDKIAEQVTEALNKAALLQSEGKLLDNAIMSVRANRLFEDWQRTRLEEFEADRDVITLTRDRQLLRIRWFEHLLSHGDGRPPTEVSDIQRQIFAGCACHPNNWDEAKAALDLIAEFRAEPRHLLRDKIEACRGLIKAADELLKFLDVYQGHIERAGADPAQWNAYSATLHEGFRQCVDEYNAKLKMAHET